MLQVDLRVLDLSIASIEDVKQFVDHVNVMRYGDKQFWKKFHDTVEATFSCVHGSAGTFRIHGMNPKLPSLSSHTTFATASSCCLTCDALGYVEVMTYSMFEYKYKTTISVAAGISKELEDIPASTFMRRFTETA